MSTASAGDRAGVRAKRVLLAVDGTPVSERAARIVADLVIDAEIVALRVAVPAPAWPTDPAGVAGAPTVVPEPDVERMDAIDHLARAGVEAQVLVETGVPADRICAIAEEIDADLVVVGSHHKGFLDRLLSPSVSDAVVHRCRRPILVVAEE